MAKSGRTVLVLGGGVGGVVAARRLRQRLGEGDNGLMIVGDKGIMTCAGWSGRTSSMLNIAVIVPSR